MNEYIPLLIYILIALLVPIAVSTVVGILGRRKGGNPTKYQAYESGYPTPPLHGRFPVKFYLVAMLFVIFDVEAASFFPWALQLRQLGLFGLLEMVSFVAVLAIGYAYVWKKGGFQWR